MIYVITFGGLFKSSHKHTTSSPKNDHDQRFKRIVGKSLFDLSLFASSSMGNLESQSQSCDLVFESASWLVGFEGSVDTSRTFACKAIRREFSSSLCEVTNGWAVRVEQLISGFKVEYRNELHRERIELEVRSDIRYAAEGTLAKVRYQWLMW